MPPASRHRKDARPPLKGVGHRITGKPWETGKGVGYHVLHVDYRRPPPLACVQMPPDEQRCATACLFLPRWPRIWARSACIPQVATDHEPEIAPDCSAMRRMLGSNISALGPTREDQRRSRALHPLPAVKWPFIPVPIRPSKGREPAKRDCPPNARGHGLASPEGRSSLFPGTTWREVTSSNFKSRLARRASRSSLRPRRPDASRISGWSRLRENVTKPYYYRVVILRAAFPRP